MTLTDAMLKHQDNIDLIRLVGTKEDYLNLINTLDQYSGDEVEKLIPIIGKKTGRSDCREIIKDIIKGNALAAC